MNTPRMTAMSPPSASPYNSAPSPLTASATTPRSPRPNRANSVRASGPSNLGPGRAASTAAAAALIDDPVTETKRVIAQVLGPAPTDPASWSTIDDEGTPPLLAQLESRYDQFRQSYRSTNGQLEADQDRVELVSILDSFIETLRTSALGALPSQGDAAQPRQQQVEASLDAQAATVQTQEVFRRRMRAKEGAEVCAAVLNQALQHQNATQQHIAPS